MAIKFHPNPGQVLMCNFEKGFKQPEIVKKRPVLVLSPNLKGRTGLVTVGVLSSTEPQSIEDYHWVLPERFLPQGKYFQGKTTWLKGDMIYTVSFERLEAIYIGQDRATGKRKYFKDRLSRKSMKEAYSCVLSGMNLGHISQYI